MLVEKSDLSKFHGPLSKEFLKDALIPPWVRPSFTPELISVMDSLYEKCAGYMDAKSSDLSNIYYAMAFGHYCHNFNNKRESKILRADGTQYMTHTIAVASILADERCDAITIQAALLHDIFEDTNISRDNVRTLFGKEVYSAIDGVTNVTGLGEEERDDETVAKFYLNLEKEPRGIFIKLADRLHNMRTLQYLSVKKRTEIARQTLDVFVDLARQVGMEKWEDELYRLAIKELAPEVYDQATAYKAKYFPSERCEYTENIFRNLPNVEGIKVQDPKFANFVYPWGREFRVISDEELTNLPSPVEVVFANEERMGEFIGFLVSTKLIDPQEITNLHDGSFEIRTKIGNWRVSMVLYRQNRYLYEVSSIADLFRVEKDYEAIDAINGKLHVLGNVIHQILETDSDRPKDVQPKTMVDSVRAVYRHDLIRPQTPTGEVVTLNMGATALEFAFALRLKNIGLNVEYAVINGQMQPLNTVLHNGDVVKIKGSDRWNVSVSWLDWVRDDPYHGFHRQIRDGLRYILNLEGHRKRTEAGRSPAKDLLTRAQIEARLQETGISYDMLSGEAAKILREAEDRGERVLKEAYAVRRYIRINKRPPPLDEIAWEQEKVRYYPKIDLKRGWEIRNTLFRVQRRELGVTSLKRYSDYDDFLINCGLDSVQNGMFDKFFRLVETYEDGLPTRSYIIPNRRGVLAYYTALTSLFADIVEISLVYNEANVPSGMARLNFRLETGNLERLDEVLKAMSEYSADRESIFSSRSDITIDLNLPSNRSIIPYLSVCEYFGLYPKSLTRIDETTVSLVLSPSPGIRDDTVRVEDIDQIMRVLKQVTNQE